MAKHARMAHGNSHVLNDKYMEDFDKAWEELNRLNMGGGEGGGSGASGAKPFRIEGPPEQRPSTALALKEARIKNLVNAAKTTALDAFVRYPAQLLASWRTGPTDPEGVLADISDRPSLCSAANWGKNEIVVGSSDHALYVMDAEKGTKKRTLYNKTSGHSEWVTCVACLPDGKVVSGGMDSKMWLWPAGTTRGIQMEGHSAPISKVEYDPSTGFVASASYDKTVRLWTLGSRGQEAARFIGHEAPVLELSVNKEGKIITGDRSGHIILWDNTASDVSWRMKNVHKGHVTALTWADVNDPDCGHLFISGGQDGYVRVWDPRTRTNPAKVQLHVNEQGRGAVSQICAGGPAASGMIVTSGADGTCRILDPRKSFALMSTIRLTNFPYSMAVAGGLALVGCGDGSLHVIDIREGKTLYGLGAHKGAVRSIEACEDRLMTSGDDGNTMLYRFS